MEESGRTESLPACGEPIGGRSNAGRHCPQKWMGGVTEKACKRSRTNAKLRALLMDYESYLSL